MSHIICQHKNRYNLYSTISDGFMFVSSLNLRQLVAWYKDQHGKVGLKELSPRVKRAQERGQSSLMGYESLDDFLCCNRAGLNEKHLTTEECIKEFLS